MFASRATRTIADRTARHFFRRLRLLKTADKNSPFVRRPGAARLRWCRRCGKGDRHWIQLGKARREAAEWSRRTCGRLPVTCQIENHRRWAMSYSARDLQDPKEEARSKLRHGAFVSKTHHARSVLHGLRSLAAVAFTSQMVNLCSHSERLFTACDYSVLPVT